MKPVEIFVLCLACLDIFLTANSSPCMEQKYEQLGSNEDVQKQFENEIGFCAHVRNFFTRSSPEIRIMPMDKVHLCACAFKKMYPDTINVNVFAGMTAVNMDNYPIAKYPYKYPYLRCTYSTGDPNKDYEYFAILKGYTRKSAGVYNIYVASYAQQQVKSFLGIIKNVDVRSTVY